MGKYKSLILNTLLFGLSTFSSKILVVLLMPLYTRLLSKSDYGTYDLVVNTCNLIVPVISLCVHEAVIRFGLDHSKKKRDIFTTAVLTILAGYAVLFAFYPLLRRVELISDYVFLIYLYTLTSALRSTVTHFVRASGFVRLFAFDGLFTTATTVGLTVLFLVTLDWGVTGYVLATICADALSAFGLIVLLRLHRFFRPHGLRRDTAREMLRYCIPLMPTAIFWWVTNLSDRYFVSYMLGVDINGLYSVAYKIPMMITLVSTIFIQAWQLSAFGEYSSTGRERFYSTVFRGYYTLVFLAASGIVLLVKPMISILVDEAYYDSWQYVPFLVLAVSCSCMVTFLGTIYNAAKKNAMVTVTTLVGAVVNILLNAWLIPIFGANGAAFATFMSFLIVMIIRAVDTRRYVSIRMQPLRIAMTLLLLVAQCLVALGEVRHWVLWECLIFALIFLCNFGCIRMLASHLLDLLPARAQGGDA